MASFRYEALDAKGSTQNGLIEADHLKAARAMLRERGLVPLQVTPSMQASGQDKSEELQIKGRAFKGANLSLWTRQLAGLVSAGLPLERALSALMEEAETDNQRTVVSQLRSEVQGGASFAKALSSVPKEFDTIYRAVVAAGEASGQLGLVLDRLASDLEDSQALQSKIWSAATYPLLVSGMATLIVMFLLTYVVPQIASVFESSHQALPFLTRFMLGASAVLRKTWWLVLLLPFIISGIWRFIRREQAVRERIDAALLHLPLLGRLMRGYNSARFAGTLAMLAGAGVPILKALQAAAETLSNEAMKQDALDLLDQVREGAPLGAALSAKKRFPGLLAMFTRLGEQTGELPQMLDRAARQLSTEVTRRAMQIATLLEPLLIITMGGIVLTIVLSVLLPIMNMQKLL